MNAVDIFKKQFCKDKLLGLIIVDKEFYKCITTDKLAKIHELDINTFIHTSLELCYANINDVPRVGRLRTVRIRMDDNTLLYQYL